MASNGSTPDNLNDSNAHSSDVPPESSASASQSASKPNVRKDRACPFCNQTFTSSSLGRHLDFFIREKNPKAPDGIHDVHQIRKLRENITRRHTRVPSGTIVDNSSRRWSVTSVASPKANIHKAPPTLFQVQQALPSPVEEDGSHRRCKNPTGPRHWTATGVINDLPPRVNSTNPLPRILPRPDVKQSMNTAHPYASLEEEDDARATELALKEVLRTVRRVAIRAQKTPLFDFDFYTSNFPSLCLRLLSPPATLFSTTPMSNPGCWPLGMPTAQHFVALQSLLTEKFRPFQVSSEGVHNPLHAELNPHRDHLDSTFQLWQSLPAPQRREFWDIEVLRAHATSTTKAHTLQYRLDQLQAEHDHLLLQLENDSQTQLQFRRQSVHHNPSSFHPRHSELDSHRFPPGLFANALLETGIDLHEWDYDRLIAKYKPIVQKTRRQSAATLATNDIRTAHERALPAFGSSNDSLLLRPIMPAHMGAVDEGNLGDGSGNGNEIFEGISPRTRGRGGNGEEAGEGNEKSGDEEWNGGDEDVNMENGIGTGDGELNGSVGMDGGGRGFVSRQGAG